MKENEDKQLEKLVDTIMNDSVLETPSSDFTSKVMSQILVSKTSEVYVYKPLISKSVFILVFICFSALFFSLEPQTGSWINRLNEDIFYRNYSTSLFSFSKITIYSVAFATIMLYFQITFLKRHFDNQFNE